MLRVAFSSVYVYSLPAGHRFPMEKYELLPEQLLREGTLSPSNFFEPDPLPEPWILRTHTSDYWERLSQLTLSDKEVRRLGFPLRAELVRRSRVIASGTVRCALYALEQGIAMNIAGGTHHSYGDHGEAFCLLNDIAIAANYLLDNGLAYKILVVDLDVHQGNGTAKIFENEPRVFTFSMHGASNYPLRKERSDLDLGLPRGMTDRPYLDLLAEHLPRLMEEVEPDFVFYLSGVDVLENDRLGHLSLSLSGCRARDQMVLECCRLNRVPVAVSMGGGYSQRLATVIDAHANTYRVAQELFF